MSTRAGTGAPVSRRERRASQRAQDRGQPQSARKSTRSQGNRLTLATIAAVVVGLAFVAVLIVENQGPGATSPVTAPTVTNPVALADGRSLGSKTAPVTIDVW